MLLPAMALLTAPAPQPEAALPAPVVLMAPAVVDMRLAVAQEPAPTELADPLADPAAVPPAAAPGEAAPATPAPAVEIRQQDRDPLEGFNRSMFGLYQTLDRFLYRPAAMGYKEVVPKPVRSGIRNFFINLTEPIVFLNYLLQLRPGRAFKTLARFTVNSTVGLAGFVDVAKTKEFNLPHVSNGLGDTLARYGVGAGPYLFLPFVGPTTLRDVLGGPVDGAVLPVAIGFPFNRWEYQVASGGLQGLDLRAESDADLHALLDGAVDPYATMRSVFLQNRAAEVEALRHPKPEGSELDAPLEDPGAGPTPAAGNAPELQDPLADPAAVPAGQ